MRKILITLTLAAALASPMGKAHAGTGIDTYGPRRYNPNPALNHLTGLPRYACKDHDPFTVRRSCYWDSREHGGRGKSYDVYTHRVGPVVTRVCVAYWDTRYSLRHNWCMHAVSVTTVDLSTGTSHTEAVS